MKLLAAAILLSAVCSEGAFAHSDEYFDKIATPHGGQIRMAGPYHLELVVGRNELTLYVTDHGDNPIDTAGGSAKAIITSGKKRYVVILSPAGENVLKGAATRKVHAEEAQQSCPEVTPHHCMSIGIRDPWP